MNSKQELDAALNRIANRLMSAIKSEMWKKGLVDTQELLNSLESRISGNDILILSAAYMPYAEFGRGSGKVPQNFASIISQWAARKNIHLNKGTYQDFGWAVAQKTKKYGSARFRGDRAPADVLSDPVNDVMEQTMDEEFAGVLSGMILTELEGLLE